MAKHQVHYGATRSAEELGALARAHRKQRRLTIEQVVSKQCQRTMDLLQD